MKLHKDYINYCKDNEIFPNVEGFSIYLMEEKGKSFTQSQELIREYKGFINTYAIAFLKQVAASGKRNSMQASILLKQMKDDNDLTTDEPINIHIDLNNTSKNSIKEKKNG